MIRFFTLLDFGCIMVNVRVSISPLNTAHTYSLSVSAGKQNKPSCFLSYIYNFNL